MAVKTLCRYTPRMHDTALSVIRTLFPTLVSSARYARLIQRRIGVVEDKEEATNIFAAALSDADLTIQTAVEVEMLAHFPGVPFFGEEWKSSRNTKYLVGNFFVDGCDYLVTLDPIDGTRHYIDGHPLYQIILAVVSRDAFEGVIVLFPEYEDYVYALRGKGTFRGTLETPIDEAAQWRVQPSSPSRVFLDDPFAAAHDEITREVDRVYRWEDYSRENQLYHVAAGLRHELSGAILARAPIIDGSALAFVAGEMGYLVESVDGKPMARPGDYPSLIVPGLVIAESEELLVKLRQLASCDSRA